jgi:hypothetical protein
MTGVKLEPQFDSFHHLGHCTMVFFGNRTGLTQSGVALTDDQTRFKSKEDQ